tara:strand:+ start:578 stop:910 length:333 start_codon:yes stop_codon:yes gene_type:complete
MKGDMMQKGLGNMMKQAQQMQSKMQEIQKELAEKKVEAESGGGMVKVTANGKGEILSIRIEKEIVKQEEKEVLEDLVLVAINEALRRSQELNASEMSKVTGGLKIPGLFS